MCSRKQHIFCLGTASNYTYLATLYGLWDVEVQIDDATWDVLDSDHRRLYLTKTRSIVDEVRK